MSAKCYCYYIIHFNIVYIHFQCLFSWLWEVFVSSFSFTWNNFTNNLLTHANK
uniref:Uncharacterized protein n=1 Tax=Anguilla anguilla TaxID=7936 RepID=A0A0E9W559_ANGAN